MNPIVSTHSRLKAAGARSASTLPVTIVSTHSRLKAAGIIEQIQWFLNRSFNTQPPEGGWRLFIRRIQFLYWFQHTAA